MGLRIPCKILEACYIGTNQWQSKIMMSDFFLFSECHAQDLISNLLSVLGDKWLVEFIFYSRLFCSVTQSIIQILRTMHIFADNFIRRTRASWSVHGNSLDLVHFRGKFSTRWPELQSPGINKIDLAHQLILQVNFWGTRNVYKNKLISQNKSVAI